MNIRREIIALVVRVLYNETTLFRKPDQFEIFLNHILGYESFDRQMARNIDAELDRAIETIKRVNLDRKFKKIVRNV